MILVQVIKILIKKLLRLSTKGFQRGPHIIRYYMYHRLSQFRISEQPCVKVLSISHSKPLCYLLGFDNHQITEANYPEYNILNLPFSDDQFDYVVSDQVLEHVQGNPQSAIDEAFRVLKPSGLAIHTTCFYSPIHRSPVDFWRFTPDALKFLCRGWSNIVEVGGWGNSYVEILSWIGLRYDGIPKAHWHPLHKLAMLNDEKCPISTWVIAQK